MNVPICLDCWVSARGSEEPVRVLGDDERECRFCGRATSWGIYVRVQPGEVCEWFATCVRPAVGTVVHPVLGKVPICEPCAARFDFTPEALT